MPHFEINQALVVDDLHQLGGIIKHLLGFVEKLIVDKHGKSGIEKVTAR